MWLPKWRKGLSILMMVGGATTSRLHTALKIAPHYSHLVIHVLDASQNPIIASKFTNKDSRDEFVTQLYSDYEALRQSLLPKGGTCSADRSKGKAYSNRLEIV